MWLVIPPGRTGLGASKSRRKEDQLREQASRSACCIWLQDAKMQRGMRGEMWSPGVCLGQSRPAAPGEAGHGGRRAPAAWTPAGRDLETSLAQSLLSPSYPVSECPELKTIPLS